jgi:hypothetical protein
VIGRLLVGGVVWLAVVALFATFLYRSARPVRVPSNESGSALVRTLNKAQPLTDTDWAPWLVTRAATAHNVMVIDVEARHLDHAKSIATEIVEPVRSRGYDEILVYVHQAGGKREGAERRVQWTPKGGYVELVLAAR